MLSEACTGKRLVQHPSDCSKYIVCDANRIAVKLFQCPGIQLFNEEIGICDQAYNVRCKIDGTTVLTASSSTTTKAPEANSKQLLSTTTKLIPLF
jgi:Chitin binding Peritrophin-A domain